MTEKIDPVIVYHGRNEFEAQMARDVLASAMIPVLHVPSLSTGIFGVANAVRIAVPREFAEAAVEALRDAGVSGRVQDRSRGIGEFQDAWNDAFPTKGSSPFVVPGRRLWPWMVAFALVVALAVWSKGC